MSETTAQGCEKTVFTDRGFSHSCSRRGPIEREGKRWCKQHDPVAVKKRLEERRARWDAEEKQRGGKFRRSYAEARACEGVSTVDLEIGLIARLLAAAEPVKEGNTLNSW